MSIVAARLGLSGIGTAQRRALRDSVASEALSSYLPSRVTMPVRPDLIGETIEFLIEPSDTRVESQDVTHGVILADVFEAAPRLQVGVPG